MRARGLITVLASVIFAGLWAPAAWGGEVTQSGTTLTYTDPASGDDNISVRRLTGGSSDTITVTRLSGPPLTEAAANCFFSGADTVSCSGANALTRVTVNSAGGTDQISFSDLGATIVAEANLGPGDDTANAIDQAPAFRLLLRGDEGGDTLLGGVLNDTLEGGEGGDTFAGSSGADVFMGGVGVDTVKYSAALEPTRVGGVSVTLDDQSNDGDPTLPIEGDNVRSDVENVDGTEQNDGLTGNAASNSLSGLGGSDQVTGGGGFDVLSGGNGDDSIAAVDLGTDQVLCGANTDTATVDPADVTSDCETLSVSEPPPTDPPPTDPPPADPPAADTDPPETLVTKSPKRKTRKRKAKVEFGSDEGGSTFACKLDRKPFAPCTSPFVAKVGVGRHKLLIQATDAAGNVDLTPAQVKWKRLET